MTSAGTGRRVLQRVHQRALSESLLWRQSQYQQQQRGAVMGTRSNLLGGMVRRDDDDKDKDQRRSYHSTVPSERAVAAIMGLATVSVLGYAGSSAVLSYNEWKAAQPSEEERAQMKAEADKEQEKQTEEQKKEEEVQSKKPRENFFKQFFDVGSKYYEGGFEDTMTKREAALILGIRESSSPQRIKAAHKKLSILNHPDTGGSTFLSGKINEARELLMKGRARA